MAMATAVRISVEEYLHSDEWEPDVDYVDGKIEERHKGEIPHGKWQRASLHWFLLHEEQWCLFACPEVRVQTSATHYRVPDVLLLREGASDEKIVTHPPVAVFEVLSPENRVQRMMRKLGDYAAMGVREIWVVDPDTAVWTRFEDGQLLRRERFALPEGGIDFAMAEIATLVR